MHTLAIQRCNFHAMIRHSKQREIKIIMEDDFFEDTSTIDYYAWEDNNDIYAILEAIRARL